MLRAHLNASLKFFTQAPVIDRDDVPALQIRGDVIDPIQRSLAKVPVAIGRTLNESKVVALEANKFLRVLTDQTHRHRVQQFVGKMNAHEWLQRIEPLDLMAKTFKRPLLPLLQNGKRLDYSVAQRCEELRLAFFCKLEDVVRELAIMRTLFNDYEVIDLSQLLPNFGKLRTEQLAEQRPHADVGKIIAVSSDRAAARGIISVFWMVKRLLHKPGE